MFNVLFVGGGAAGFFGAIQLASRRPDLKIAILERGKTVLSKVKISGGGRCNVTHAAFDPKELVVNYPRGEKELLGPFHQFSAHQPWSRRRSQTHKGLMLAFRLICVFLPAP